MNVNELHIKGISIDWDRIGRGSYLIDIPSIAVAYGFNPEGGTRNYSFSTYDSHSELCNAIRLIKEIHKAGWGYDCWKPDQDSSSMVKKNHEV